jgi:hypothetical protein
MSMMSSKEQRVRYSSGQFIDRLSGFSEQASKMDEFVCLHAV